MKRRQAKKVVALSERLRYVGRTLDRAVAYLWRGWRP